MVRNLLAEGSAGELHGRMHTLVRNPFATRFMRGSYEAIIRAYDTRHRDLIRPNGARHIGNSWATSFWQGFEGHDLNWDRASKQTAGYAAWRAGRDVARAIAHARRKEEPETAPQDTAGNGSR